MEERKKEIAAGRVCWKDDEVEGGVESHRFESQPHSSLTCECGHVT